MNDYKEIQRQHSDARISKQNAETRKKTEKNRHRRPVKPKPVGDIDFKMM